MQLPDALKFTALMYIIIKELKNMGEKIAETGRISGGLKGAAGLNYTEMSSGQGRQEMNGRDFAGLFERDFPPENTKQLRIISSVNELYMNEAEKKYEGFDLMLKKFELQGTDYDKEYEKLFDYLAATRDLETDTDRTIKIQKEIIDKMVPDDIQKRIVIMRRGDKTEGFVTPDGTIFIPQALINFCDSYDELAAAYAHELSHLILKTGVKKALDGSINTFGIGWAHETAGDQYAVALLEKGGFKATAFATLIEKLQGNKRGSIHQGGLMRAVQNYAGLGVVDRTTSNKELTPIDPELKGPAREANTNLIGEIMQGERLKDLSDEDIKDLTSKLHPKDLETFYNKVTKYNRTIENEHGERVISPAVLAVKETITKRIESMGYNKEQANIFLYLVGGNRSRITDAYFFKEPEDFVKICKALCDFENTDLINRMHNDVFQSDFYDFMEKNKERFSARDQYNYPAVSEFFSFLIFDVYDIDFEQKKTGIPVTKQTFLAGLKALNGEEGSGYYRSGSNEIGKIIGNYLMHTVIGKAVSEGVPVNRKDIEAVLDEITAEDINLYPFALKEMIVNSTSRNKLKFNNREYDIPEDDKDRIVKTIEEYYNLEIKKEEKTEFGFSNLDLFVKALENKGLSDVKRAEAADKLHFTMRKYLNENNPDDAQMLTFAMYILDKLYSANIKYNFPLFDYMKNPGKYVHPVDRQGREHLPPEKHYPLTPEEEELNEKYNKFSIGVYLGTEIFRSDGDEFYTYLHALSERSGIDFDKLSKVEAINLGRDLLLSEGHIYNIEPVLFGDKYPVETWGSRQTRVTDYTRFFELPIMRRMAEAKNTFNARSFEELLIKSEDFISNIDFMREQMKLYGGIYHDSLLSLIIGDDMRNECQKLIKPDLPDNELLHLADFLKIYYPDGVQKNVLTREINKRYLESAQISIDDKISYLLKNIEVVGVEGLALLADHITDINDFRNFKKRLGKHFDEYLSGSTTTTMIAAGDFISSYLTGNFEQVFSTAFTDEDNKREISTGLAKKWFETTMSDDSKYTGGGVTYDKSQKKFAAGRSSHFKTLHDYFDVLRDLTTTQRALAVIKLLAESNGGLTTPENREKVAAQIVQGLNLKDGFLKSVLSAAIKESDAKLVTFPVAQIIGPLLFRALDEQKIDIDQVSSTALEKDYDFGEKGEWIETVKKRVSDELSDDEIRDALSATTRDVKIFGVEYAKHPNSLIYPIAQQSDRQYEAFTGKLNDTIGSPAAEDKNNIVTSGIDPSTEALIRAVEISGALGVRALQLTTQFEDLPPELDKRLSQSFDANRGMEKLRFWLNLDKLASENPEIEEFVKNIKLGEYKGGGSLQTTYAAKYTPEGEAAKDVVLRMKNPNVELFIDEVYKSAMKSLETVVAESKDPEVLRKAKVGMMLLDLSREWCKADIADANYEASDDQFRVTIDNFNKQENENFYAPERILTHPKLKVETLGEGRTVNQFLNDKSIEAAKKQKVIESLSNFFIYQLKNPSYIDGQGNRMHIKQSDPHIGNFLITNEGSNPKIGVIDRDYYLHLDRPDVEVLNKLMHEQNPHVFASSFIDRLLEVNKVRGLQKQIQKGKILGKLGLQLAGGESDNMMLLRTLITEFTSSGMEVPIGMRIMIRNVEAFKKLNRKYGLEF